MGSKAILLFISAACIIGSILAQTPCENPSDSNCAACNFQTNLCGWNTNSATASKWERVQVNSNPGSNPSGARPPTTDGSDSNTGYYMKLTVGQTGSSVSPIPMISPLTGPLHPACRMTFKYYIDSTFKPNGRPDPLSILSLQVYLVNQTNLDGIPDLDTDIVIQGTERLLFTTNYPTSNKWMTGIVNVGYMLRTHGFQFRATKVQNDWSVADNNKPEIAIDDVTFTGCTANENKIPTDKLACTFNEAGRPWCDYHSETGSDAIFYRQSPNIFSWIGPAAEILGPKTDHALGTSKGNYLILHSLINELNRVARVTSKTVTLASGQNDKCLSFWYHMMGPDINQQFTVYLRYVPTTDSKLDRTQYLWRKTKQHGDEWRQVQIHFTAKEDFQVVFEGKVGYNPFAYIALDDVQISEGDCKFEFWHCEFNPDECGSVNHANNRVNWIRQRGNDHSSGTRAGAFMEVDLPAPSEPTTQAWLLSPELYAQNLRPGYCVTFYYRLLRDYNFDMLQAYVFQNPGSGNNIDLSSGLQMWNSTPIYESSYGQQWHMGYFQTGISNKTRIGFSALHTTSSASISFGQRISLDDVWIYPGFCMAPGSCNFENDFCSYWNTLQSPLDFLRHTGAIPMYGMRQFAEIYSSIRFNTDIYGPLADHTFQNGLGNYAFSLWLQNFTILDEGLPPNETQTMASLGSEIPRETISDRCVEFFYWVEGTGGSLELWDRRVDRANRANKIWETTSSSYEIPWQWSWVQGKANIIASTDTIGLEFKNLYDYKNGNSLVAIDDISIGYGVNCTCPTRTSFKCPSASLPTIVQCINITQVCDFRKDCLNGEDELNCGPCTFTTDNCGWTLNNNTDQKFGIQWAAANMPGSSGSNKRVIKLTQTDPLNSGINGKASMVLREFGPTSPTCIMFFYYQIQNNFDNTNNADRIELSLNLVYFNESGPAKDVYKLWSTRTNTNNWQRAFQSLRGPVARGFRLEFRARNLRYINAQSMPTIALDNIEFFGCTKMYQEPNCDFNTNTCNWAPTLIPWAGEAANHLEWQQGKGHAPGQGQGPSTDATGSQNGGYVVVFGKNTNSTILHKAIVSGPMIKRHVFEPKCWRFAYHFFGIEPQTLYIWQQFIETHQTDPKRRLAAFSREKQHGNYWKWVSATIYGDDDYSIVVEADVGNQGSHIAIDELTITPGECPLSNENLCDFEGGVSTCSFVNGGTVQEGGTFLVRKANEFGDLGQTALEILPEVDHTTTSEWGHMAVADLRDIVPDEHGHILTKMLQTFSFHPTVGDNCLSFYYTIGEGAELVVRVDYGLNVSGELDYDYDDWRPKHSRSVARKDPLTLIIKQDAELFWHFGQLNIPATNENIIITFNGRARTSTGEFNPRRLLALDDLSLKNGKCQPTASCNFEKTTCGYANINSLGIKDPKSGSRSIKSVNKFQRLTVHNRLLNTIRSKMPFSAETFATSYLLDWEHTQANELTAGLGPNSDAGNNRNGWYMWMPLNPAVIQEEAYLISETVNVDPSDTVRCLKFKHNVKSSATGVALEATLVEGTVAVSRWNVAATNQDAWGDGYLEVRTGLSQWNAVFVLSKRAGSSGGWAAIDDVMIVDGPCPFQSTTGQVTQPTSRSSSQTSGASQSSQTGMSSQSTSQGNTATAQAPQEGFPQVVGIILIVVAAILVIVVIILGAGLAFVIVKRPNQVQSSSQGSNLAEVNNGGDIPLKEVKNN